MQGDADETERFPKFLGLGPPSPVLVRKEVPISRRFAREAWMAFATQPLS